MKKPLPKQGPGEFNDVERIRELDHPGQSWNPSELMIDSK